MESYEVLAAMVHEADISKIAELSRRQEYDLFSRMSILTAGVMGKDLKEFAREKYRGFVHGSRGTTTFYQNYLQQQIEPIWKKIFSENQHWFGGLLTLPQPVFTLEFPFRLNKPLLMRDDDIFYPIDNPVRKEHVFKKPMLSASGWKGLLRHVLWARVMEACEQESAVDQGNEERSDSVALLLDMARLFGDIKELDSERPGIKYGKPFPAIFDAVKKEVQSTIVSNQGRLPSFAGCLHFYPTFFSRVDLEIINPHDRKRRVGKNPIYLECVPAGDVGELKLAYVQVPAWAENEKNPTKLASKDIERVVALLEELLHVRGISAKRSSGYGLVANGFPDGRAGRLFANFYPEALISEPVFTFHSLAELRKQCQQRRID
jgi:CRISPR-associated protein Cmr2